MNQFIKPPYEKLEYGKYENHKNNPVNLANVKGIEKEQYKYYPDNDGVASIKFLGTKITWLFENTKERDNYFEAIADNNFNIENRKTKNNKFFFEKKDEI